MTDWMILGYATLYLLAGTFCSGCRAWRMGTHYIRHGGSRRNSASCDHWACDSMTGETLTLILVLWPVVVPVQLCRSLVDMVIRAPYLRSLPPKDSRGHEAVTRELVDAALGLGRVTHLTDDGSDEKWTRLDNAIKAMMASK
jgi:hypothetical protein